jgi:hypothetical protein
MRVLKGIYRHYKGELYNVLYTAVNEGDMKKVVIYQGKGCMENPLGLWVRPIHEFKQYVMFNGVYVKRFERIKKIKF